jgi:hypothetical protein
MIDVNAGLRRRLRAEHFLAHGQTAISIIRALNVECSAGTIAHTSKQGGTP